MFKRVAKSLIRLIGKITGTEISVSYAKSDRPGHFQDLYIPKADLRMHLELHQSLDRDYSRGILDFECLEFLKAHLGAGKVFLDIGANQGLYSCWVLRHIPGAKVIAFEPDPYSIAKFEKNIELNRLGSTDYVLRSHALSDNAETKLLMLNTAGNRAGSSMVVDQRKWQPENVTIEVPCLTLSDSLRELEIRRVDAVKMDIEGFEYPVLKKFFDEAPTSLYPTAMVVEAFGHVIKLVGGSPIELLLSKGYRLVNHVEYNYFFELKSP